MGSAKKYGPSGNSGTAGLSLGHVTVAATFNRASVARLAPARALTQRSRRVHKGHEGLPRRASLLPCSAVSSSRFFSTATAVPCGSFVILCDLRGSKMRFPKPAVRSQLVSLVAQCGNTRPVPARLPEKYVAMARGGTIPPLTCDTTPRSPCCRPRPRRPPRCAHSRQARVQRRRRIRPRGRRRCHWHWRASPCRHECRPR